MLKVYDLNSKLLIKKIIKKDITSFSVVDLSKGLYILVVENGNSKTTHKLLIK